MKTILILLAAIFTQSTCLARVYVLADAGTYKYTSDASAITSDTSFLGAKLKSNANPFAYGFGVGIELLSDQFVSICAEGVYGNSFHNTDSAGTNSSGSNYTTTNKLRTNSFEGRGDIGINFTAKGLRIRPFFGLGTGTLRTTNTMSYAIISNSPQDQYFAELKDTATLRRVFVGMSFFDDKRKLGSKMTIGHQTLVNRQTTVNIGETVSGVSSTPTIDGSHSLKLDSIYLNVTFMFMF